MSVYRNFPRLLIAAGIIALVAAGCNTPGQLAQTNQAQNPVTAAVGQPTQPPATVTPAAGGPTSPAGDGTAATATFDPAVVPPQGEAHRITFEAGGISASVQGTSTPAERVTYVVNAMKTQTMTVSLTSSASLGLGVVGPTTVLQNAADGKSSWSGMLDVTGDYILFVQTLDGSSTPFTLQVTIPPPPAPTATVAHACNIPAPDASIPNGASWATYCSPSYGFGFRYPPGTLNHTEQFDQIALPFAPGTNLVEKLLAVVVKEGATDCSAANASPYQDNGPTSEMVTFNGVPFKKESYAGVGAGNLYESVTYSTLRGQTCLGLTFTLHSGNLGNYATPPAAFDKDAESAVFEQIMATFAWPG